MAEPSAASGASLAAPNGHRMPASSAATNGASGLRRDLLLHLRLDGPSSPEALAGRLGVSRTGVLQQLRALEAAGLVSRQAVRHGVGRPRHVYDITEAAQELFPTNYDGFANGLLAAIRSIGGDELVRSVFDERRRIARDRIHERLCERLPADASVLDRARELAVIQDDLGYLAEAVIGPDGVIRLVERNCAIHHVAAADGAACQAELDLFREILGPDVERETHIASGDRCCTYRIGAAAPER